ncbi:MAG: hypothetical protein ACP5NX_01075 [Candidatus Bilamarchaeaceae archaeon]
MAQRIKKGCKSPVEPPSSIGDTEPLVEPKAKRVVFPWSFDEKRSQLQQWISKIRRPDGWTNQGQFQTPQIARNNVLETFREAWKMTRHKPYIGEAISILREPERFDYEVFYAAYVFLRSVPNSNRTCKMPGFSDMVEALLAYADTCRKRLVIDDGWGREVAIRPENTCSLDQKL